MWLTYAPFFIWKLLCLRYGSFNWVLHRHRATRKDWWEHDQLSGGDLAIFCGISLFFYIFVSLSLVSIFRISVLSIYSANSHFYASYLLLLYQFLSIKGKNSYGKKKISVFIYPTIKINWHARIHILCLWFTNNDHRVIYSKFSIAHSYMRQPGSCGELSYIAYKTR